MACPLLAPSSCKIGTQESSCSPVTMTKRFEALPMERALAAMRLRMICRAWHGCFGPVCDSCALAFATMAAVFPAPAREAASDSPGFIGITERAEALDGRVTIEATE